MKRENAIFLAVGFAFGSLFGLGLFNALQETPDLHASNAQASAAGPQGPMAPTQVGSQAAGGAPMMAEIRALRERVQANPRDDEALIRLANIYHDAGMFDQAIDYYQKALAVNPNMPDWLTDLGICYRSKQQYDKALESFRKAQQIDPKHWQSLFNIAVVAGFDLKQYDTAMEAVAAMERMNPVPPQVADLREALERARADGAKG